jgi:hypothetical protein
MYIALAALSPMWATGPLAAQEGFEGVITRRVAALHGRELSAWVKGSRFRAEMPRPDGSAFTMIGDENGRIMMLMDTQKRYVTMPASEVTHGNGASAPTVTSGGRSETIVGYPCKYYHLHRAPGGNAPVDEDICVTTALGHVTGVSPGMDEAFIRRTWPNGFLVLKSVDGKVMSEVTRIEKTSVSDAQFSPPADYTEMKMPGLPGFLRKP